LKRETHCTTHITLAAGRGTGIYREGKSGFRAMGPAAVLLCLTLPLTAFFPSFWRTFFCAPTAGLAAAFLHAPWTASQDGYLIELPLLAVQVTLACSGAQFFCLLWSLMMAVGAGPCSAWHGLTLRSLAGYAVLAYTLTMLVNTARVVVGWWAGLWARRVLPETFHAGVHLITGIIVFTCFLVAGYALAVWLASRNPLGGRACCAPRTATRLPSQRDDA
jgi:exosortase/archaeosortase family protein